jgi:hypothetical protein
MFTADRGNETWARRTGAACRKLFATDFLFWRSLTWCSRRAVSARERRSGPDDRYAGWQLAFPGGVARGGWYGRAFGGRCARGEVARQSLSDGDGGVRRGKTTEHGPRSDWRWEWNYGEGDDGGTCASSLPFQPTIHTIPISIKLGARTRPNLPTAGLPATYLSHKYCNRPQSAPWSVASSHV